MTDTDRRVWLASIVGAVLALVSVVAAQSPAGETVTYKSGEATISGYLATPTGAGTHPAVIVIHDDRGLSDHFRDVARRFAAEGFVALAPDVRPRPGVPVTTTIDDLRAGVEFLSKHPRVDAARLGSVGFGWGAWRSFTLATAAPNLRKVVLFYGSSPDAGFEKIQASVLAHYADWDNQVTGNAIWTREMMGKAGKQFQYFVYPRTDSAFFNDTSPRYAPEAAKLAWKRTVDFLKG